MGTLILHHNLSPLLALIASVATTFARFAVDKPAKMRKRYWRFMQLRLDAAALNYIKCFCMELFIAHANKRMILVSVLTDPYPKSIPRRTEILVYYDFSCC